MTLAYTELKKFEGIGSKVAEKLVKYFGGELEAVNAIKNYKVTEIAAIRGISFKKAFKLVNDYREKQIGISLEEILRSQEIKRIHESILKIASSYANTMQGRDAISLYFPLPRSKIELIQERIDYFNDAKNCVEMLDTKNIKEMKFLLSKVKPLKITGSSVIRKKLILVDDEEDYQNILEEDLTKFCDIDLIDRRKLEDEEFFIEASNNYDLIFIISSQNYTFLEEFENIIYLNEFELMKIIPENVLNVFALNKITIKAARELYKKILRLKENKSIKKFQDPNDLEILNEINEFLNLINPDGTLKEDINPEIFKLRQNLDEFDGFLHDLEYEINESITNQINGLEIKLSGNQILDILKVGSGLDENELDIRKYLPEEISEIIQNELKESINKILDAFDLKKNDEELVFPLFENETGTLPIEVNKLEAKKLKKIIEKRYYMKEYNILLQQAEKIQKYEFKFREIIQKIFTFDEFFAIGLFSTEYGLNPPRISQDDIGVSFQRGFNLFLKENVLEVDDFRVEKVNYKIGVSPLFDEETQNERTIILSGANSGGKTCLLQTIAQISIMAQMGILVPAETCIVSIFDELYYYEKSSGMLNSGAFEASLRQFNYTCLSDKVKLVLFDELEAITEPGSATKIIARLLELLDASNNCVCCLVSHLAEQIKSVIQIPIRIDGIEASGIKNGRLIVNRNPRFNYLARSMPYLIIEKLIMQSDGKEREIYEQLMSRMK
ncbi:MAG: MutS-related protein [Candidatus Helarchaeota archaeon]